MKRLRLAFLLCLGTGAAAQSLPVPDPADPRLQTFSWVAGQTIRITALPRTGLTVMLEPGETISEISLDRRGAFDVRVSIERDSFLLIPQTQDATANLQVMTNQRMYSFLAETGEGPAAAYLVRYQADTPDWIAASRRSAAERNGTGPAEVWLYRLRGDRSVRPAEISDDGNKTRIRFAPDQSLPAIFAIGPTGDEQLVNGHMRGDVFVIDRVWQELVFRIDKDRARAERNDAPEVEGD